MIKDEKTGLPYCTLCGDVITGQVYTVKNKRYYSELCERCYKVVMKEDLDIKHQGVKLEVPIDDVCFNVEFWAEDSEKTEHSYPRIKIEYDVNSVVLTNPNLISWLQEKNDDAINEAIRDYIKNHELETEIDKVDD